MFVPIQIALFLRVMNVYYSVQKTGQKEEMETHAIADLSFFLWFNKMSFVTMFVTMYVRF